MLKEEKKVVSTENVNDTDKIRKDKYQFVLKVNNTIIYQRYFKIHKFNKKSLESIDLKEMLDYCANLIKDDLKWKTYDYLFYADPPTKIKMTGFYSLRQNPINEPTYIEIPRPSDYEFFNAAPKEGEYVFTFSFLIDENPYYVTAWDGNIYPKMVRTNIDLTNTPKYQDKNIDNLKFKEQMLRRFAEGKEDVAYKIMKNICEVCTREDDDYDSYDVLR